GAGTTGGAGATGGAGTTGGAGMRGGAGATGGAGLTGGAAGKTGAGGALDTSDDVLTRNKHETRDGFFIQPTLTKAAAMKMALDTGFKATFTGVFMYGSPLYVSNGPQGKGAFIAATTNNEVYVFDETTGAVLWMHSIGSAPAMPGVACGNVKPVGITSTPVIDAAARTIYVAGAIGTTQIDRHEIHALSLDDGSERPGWPVNVSALQGPGAVAFNSPAQNQRSALSLVNGIVYVAYGGHAGDCGTYHGWVIAVDPKAPTKPGVWMTAGVGEAIWAAGGMASDGTGVFAVTGNRLPDSATHQDSEEVVRLTGMGDVDRTTGIYYPAGWRTMDQQDADFGASSPVVVSVPGSKPATLVAAAAKDGHLYLLDPANLGGMAGHLQDLVVATGGPMLIRSVLAAYTSTTGVHVVLNTVAGASCGGGGVATVSVGIAPGSPPVAKQAWCFAGGFGQSPIATSTDGTNETIVWTMNGNKLNAIDGDAGTMLYDGGNAGCSGVRSFTSPIAVKGRIVVGGDNQLCSWSPH
ncbi:MAG TPA: hypothetical protein VHL80_15800, partial [Polyangia bacterium]|nr:hypothetical protein [Polyangia bacterium]